jgi:ribosome biogenesis GTPase A
MRSLGNKVVISSRCCRRIGRFLSVSRQQYEEEHHLARGLSRFEISVAEQKKWQKAVKEKWKAWIHQPLELVRSPSYEFNALQDIHKLSYEAKVLLEIRDVRLPASTHHPSFTRLARHRLHLICYTHADLIDKPSRDRVEDWTSLSWPDSRCIFVDTRENRKGQDLNYGLVYDSLMNHLEAQGGMNVALTVGVANTGKSSLLMNLLRHAKQQKLIPKQTLATVNTIRKKGNKRRVGKAGPPAIEDKPGKTRELTEYLLRESPRAFFLDVPGMTPPPFMFEERPEAWYGMAAANLLPLSKDLREDPDGQTMICQYVLHCLNRDGNFSYVKKVGLKEPTEDISKVLAVLGGERGKSEDYGKINLRRCSNFLKFLNTGNFGSVILDDIRHKYQPFVFKDKHFQRKNDDDHDDDDYNEDDTDDAEDNWHIK